MCRKIYQLGVHQVPTSNTKQKLSSNNVTKTPNFPHHFLKDFDLSFIPSFACALLVVKPSPFQILVTALLFLFLPSSTLFPLSTAMHDLVPVFFATSLLLTLTEPEALPPSSLEEVVTLAVSPLPACFLVLLQGLR